MNIETVYKPNKEHIVTIENYLISEQITGNLSSILSSYERNELIVLFKGNQLVGFSAYKAKYPVSEIDVLEIKKEYRKKGLGEKLVNDTLREIKTKKAEIIELFCSPRSSEPFWKKNGFINFPTFPYNSQVRMYKPLIQTAKLMGISDNNNNNNIIELWNEEPSIADRIESTWKWKLNFEDNDLILEKPIIFPAHYDWQICWRKGDLIIEKDKVKYFKAEKILNSDFIIIRKIKNYTQHNKT